MQQFRHATAVVGLAWSPDGSRLLTVPAVVPENPIRDLRTGTVAQVLRRGASLIDAVVFTADGRFVLTPPTRDALQQDPGAVAALWDAATGAPAGFVPGSEPGKEPPLKFARRFSLSRDGRFLAALPYGSRGRPVVVYETANWTRVGSFAAPRFSPTAIALSPDGSRLAVGGGPSGHILIFATRRPGADTPELEFDAYPDIGAVMAALAWSPDGQSLASGPATAATSRRLPNGRYEPILAADSVRVWRATDGMRVVSLQAPYDGVRDLSWSPDGTQLALAATFADGHGGGGEARLWVLGGPGGSGACSAPVFRFRYGATAVAFSPDGRSVAAAGDDLAVVATIRP